MGVPHPRPSPLDQALRYLSLGFSVIPLKCRDKRPALASWKEFQTRRATPEEIQGWFTGKELNVGIVTGAVSGIVVIDADNSEADVYVTNEYPTTMRSKTSHGRHHIYGHPGHEVRNGAKLKGKALDIRGDGGYIVAPGSIHPDGSLYQEEGNWEDPASLPIFQGAWLGEPVPLIHPQKALDNRIQRFVDAIPGAPQGQRDAEAFRVACKLIRDKGLPEDQTLGFLQSWNARCTPPLPDEDLKRKLISALKYGRASMGSDVRSPRRPSWSPLPSAAGTPVEEGGSGNLLDLLTKNEKGNPKKTPGNLAKILRLDPQWSARLARNEMTRDVLYDGSPVGEAFIDFVQEVIEDHYGLPFGREEVSSKLVAQAEQQMIHPVREMLLSLPEWDGVERVGKLSSEILGNETPMARQFLIRFLVGACRRVLQPGCKLDAVPVFVGAQGIGKSTFWRILAGDAWFCDSAVDLESKDGPLVIHRSWITELGEIDHVTSTRAQERVKQFLSQSKDVFRPPFGKAVQVFPRSCVMVGTTNREGFLTDPTGSRRYWPILVTGMVKLELLAQWRDQVLAEAMHLEANGIEHWLPHSMETLREQDSEQFEAQDPWDSLIDDAIAGLVRLNRLPQSGYTGAEIMTQMGLSASQQTRATQMKLAELLKRKGWRQTQNNRMGDRRRVWHPAQPQPTQPVSTPLNLLEY